HIIKSLKTQGATVNAWGVGTRLATAYEQPALGGVYKLTALRQPGSSWRHTLKLSEQTAKISIPGILQTRRYRSASGFLADAIFDELTGIPESPTLVDPLDITRQKPIAAGTAHEDLLVPVQRAGRVVYQLPSIHASRQRTHDQLGQLHPGIKRFLNPLTYPVGLEKNLHDLRTNLILMARGLKAS